MRPPSCPVRTSPPPPLAAEAAASLHPTYANLTSPHQAHLSSLPFPSPRLQCCLLSVCVRRDRTDRPSRARPALSRSPLALARSLARFCSVLFSLNGFTVSQCTDSLSLCLCFSCLSNERREREREKRTKRTERRRQRASDLAFSPLSRRCRAEKRTREL